MFVLTLIADPASRSLTPALIARVRAAVQGGEPVWLAPDEAVDIPCPAIAEVTPALAGAPVDAILQPTAGRRKHLLVADMDSTIITSETLDELAVEAGFGERVAAITRRSMNGEIDFASALRERVAMLRGLSTTALDAVWARTVLMPGARALVATMRANGATTALVSGGFTWFTARVAAASGFDLHRANILEHEGGTLTGTVAEPILDRDAKRRTLLEFAAARGVDVSATLAVGDGANDLDMLATAGLGVAFRARPAVAARARVRVDHAGLRALLFAQGYTAADIVG